MDIEKYWQAVLKQDADEIRMFFNADAVINWHCTNERFSVEEFIRANCEYPGNWDGRIERIEENGNLIITATNVFTTDKSLSFHAVSFIRIENGRISLLDEYWGDDGLPPQWRQDKRIGKTIK